jgi:hypothetical protein
MNKDHDDSCSSPDKGDDCMTTVALPKKSMVIIDENKFQKFMTESEKHKVTPDFLKKCQKFEKNIIRKDK